MGDEAGRLLRAGEGEPQDRLGAILILLFGQQATRVARLRASAVSLGADGRVHIALGDTPVRLREPLASLAVTVADDARQAGTLSKTQLRRTQLWPLPVPCRDGT
jgi:hypothetical protein